MVAQQQHVVLGRTGLGSPLDEVGQRVGIGYVTFEGPVAVRVAQLVVRLHLRVNGEAIGIACLVLILLVKRLYHPLGFL